MKHLPAGDLLWASAGGAGGAIYGVRLCQVLRDVAAGDRHLKHARIWRGQWAGRARETLSLLENSFSCAPSAAGVGLVLLRTMRAIFLQHLLVFIFSFRAWRAGDGGFCPVRSNDPVGDIVHAAIY